MTDHCNISRSQYHFNMAASCDMHSIDIQIFPHAT